jgi:ribonuclease D
MIEYASNDTRYLIPLYEIQIRELADKGRLEWVLEECRDLTQVRSSPPNDRPLFLKIKGAGRLDPRSLAILETLLEFRLTIAEEKDRPLFKVMGTAALIKIATAQPATLPHLIETRALSEKQVNMYGNALVKRIREALALSTDALPRYPRFRARRISNEESARLKLLRQWREQKAKNLKIDPGVLINNAALSAIAEADPQTPEDLNAAPMLKNWQKNALGPDILKALDSGRVD